MEQLTPKEWAEGQLKRAPSFGIGVGVVTLFLIISAFIEYSAALSRAELEPMVADIMEEAPPKLEEIKKEIDPDEPELKEMEDVPEVDDANAVPVDAPLDDVTLDIAFTEDATSDVSEPTDPFPMTNQMAVIGTSPGTGGFRGTLGARSPGGKRSAAGKFGMPGGTNTAILWGLRWLKNAQEPDGSWNPLRWPGGSNAVRPGPGVSGLALLAFLGYGCTDRHSSGPLGEFAGTVRKAVEYLVQHQTAEGKFPEFTISGGQKVPPAAEQQMYGQGICTMALAEACAMGIGRYGYGTSGVNNERLKQAAQAGMAYIVSQQGPGGGFGYWGARNDCSVTAFQIQAIKAARTAGLQVSQAAIDKTENYLRRSLMPDGSSPYRVPPTDGSGWGWIHQDGQRLAMNAEVAHAWSWHRCSVSMTAAMLTGRLFMGHKPTSPECTGQVKWLVDKDYWRVGNRAKDLYSIYYLCLSMFQMGGKYWDKWNEAFNQPLRRKQVKKGHMKGSWPFKDTAWGSAGGRVYTTAMACLCLEVYFRYMPSYR